MNAEGRAVVRIVGPGPGPLLLARELVRRRVPVVAEPDPNRCVGDARLSPAALQTLRIAIAGCAALPARHRDDGGATVPGAALLQTLDARFPPVEAGETTFDVEFAPDADLRVGPGYARLPSEPADRALLDAGNLAWKLALVARGEAPERLLESVAIERRADAPSPLHSRFSVEPKFRAGPAPGARVVDRAIRLADTETRLVDLIGPGALGLFFTGDYSDLPARLADGMASLSHAPPQLSVVLASARGGIESRFACIRDAGRALHKVYGAMTGAFYLIRPDGIVAARWQHPGVEAISAALRRMIGHTDSSARPARSSGR